jgi:aromatic ring hydroxylase
LANKFDEVDALVVFDNVLIPWENVLFYRHTKAATFIRATLHRYSAFAFMQRVLKFADIMIGAALFNVRQTGLDGQQAVQDKLAQLAAVHRNFDWDEPLQFVRKAAELSDRVMAEKPARLVSAAA